MSSGISADLVRKTLEALGFSFDQKLEDEVVCSLLSRLGLPQLARRYARASCRKAVVSELKNTDLTGIDSGLWWLAIQLEQNDAKGEIL
jgi:hypothetical protein